MDIDEEIEIKDSKNSNDDNSNNEDDKNNEKNNKPICIIILGMAGSGKSSLCSKLTKYLFGKNLSPYIINCDPACLNLDYPCNIDIRDSIHYKNVMEKYRLGPNGSIITSLNLFVTRFDQVLNLIDKRKNTYKYVLLDTPGQVEVFTWSASGSIITDSLASKYPTIILFVIDTVRSHNPTTFMSNMLYACSIMYKYKLPIIIVLNKIDIIDYKFAIEWIKNSEIFENEINKDDTYMACLNQSLVSALDIFYQDLSIVGVSSKNGENFDKLLVAIDDARNDYEKNYRKEFEQQQKQKQENKIDDKDEEQLEQKTNNMTINDDQSNDDLITFGHRKIDMDI